MEIKINWSFPIHNLIAVDLVSCNSVDNLAILQMQHIQI